LQADIANPDLLFDHLVGNNQEIVSPHSVLLGAVFGQPITPRRVTRRQWAKDQDVGFGSIALV
jgi:hypothetical protein